MRVSAHAKLVFEALCELAGLILGVFGVLALLYVEPGGGWLLAVGCSAAGAVPDRPVAVGTE